MRWHWQNLNETGKRGGALREGRGWLHFSDYDGPTLGVSWQVPTRFLKVGLDIGGGGGEYDLSVTFACGLFALWLHLERVLPRSWRPSGEKETSVWLMDWAIYWKVWVDPWSWSKSTPRWRDGSFHPLDFFLGRWQYETMPVSETRVVVPMPEGDYPASVQMFVSTWKRPRWPWPTRMLRATITPDRPIPHPGKGENAWDVGDDATHSMTCPAQTPQAAAMELRDSVMRSRERYGGRDWRPEVLPL